MNDLEKCENCNRLVLAGETVTISVSEYELLKSKAMAAYLGILKNYRKMSGTAIARNPDYAEFVLARMPTMKISEVLKAFEQRFGVGHVSRSQLYRFTLDMGLRKSR